MERRYNVMSGGTIICRTGKAPMMYADCLGYAVQVERLWAANALRAWRADTRLSAHAQNTPYRR